MPAVRIIPSPAHYSVPDDDINVVPEYRRWLWPILTIFNADISF